MYADPSYEIAERVFGLNKVKYEDNNPLKEVNYVPKGPELDFKKF